MAFKAKDGKSFGNRQQMGAYEERSAKKPVKAEHAEPETDEAGSDQPIEDVVAEHGPAEKIEIEHDHEAGKHTVHSHHGGHKHTAHHGSAHEAHMHAIKAAGVEQSEEQQQEPAMAGMGGAGEIPGM